MASNVEKVAILGSGNWGSAIAKIAGSNAAQHSQIYSKTVPLWVFEEQVNGRNLTEIINEQHENVKYLPGHKLPENVVAIADAAEAVKDATMLVFVVPHQFLQPLLKSIKDKVLPNAKAITLIKGVQVDASEISIFADIIEKELGISCSALSGANIADEIAKGLFSETTIGVRDGKTEDGLLWKHLLQTPYFHVRIIEDVTGVSLCGALKNVVAIAAGFVDGLDWGSNAKAAIMRVGITEMHQFAMRFFPGCRRETFVEESSGIADLITTCLGGRNRKCAEAFARTGKPIEQIENEILGGQKLAGTGTAKELNVFLKAKNAEKDFPLFTAVYKIVFEDLSVKDIAEELTFQKRSTDEEEIKHLTENRTSNSKL